MPSHPRNDSIGVDARTETARPLPDPDIARGPFLIDGHVHFHPSFDRDRFLDSAAANFRQAAGSLGANTEYRGCLLLAESAGMHYFRSFRDAASRTAGSWTFHRTAEAGSVLAQRAADTRLLLVAGRQIITTERLEVLALCCNGEVDDGLPLLEVVHAANSLDAIVVLPWAFGKWWFRRGNIIDRFVRSAQATGIFLGDNGGRIRFGPRPRPFRVAESRGIRILPGSDPLPFDSDMRRIGSYGFAIDGKIETARPAAGLKHLLRNPATHPLPYGNLIGMPGFCRNQLLIRISPQRTRVRRAVAE